MTTYIEVETISDEYYVLQLPEGAPIQLVATEQNGPWGYFRDGSFCLIPWSQVKSITEATKERFEEET